jgi:hypothetical protein
MGGFIVSTNGVEHTNSKTRAVEGSPEGKPSTARALRITEMSRKNRVRSLVLRLFEGLEAQLRLPILHRFVFPASVYLFRDKVPSLLFGG